jgi:hypothetical protein
MSDIGLRSGKIRAGLYACGEYRIERQPSDYWWIKLDGIFIEQHKTLTEAYYSARYKLPRKSYAET